MNKEKESKRLALEAAVRELLVGTESYGGAKVLVMEIAIDNLRKAYKELCEKAPIEQEGER